jgi:hypothetical protein
MAGSRWLRDSSVLGYIYRIVHGDRERVFLVNFRIVQARRCLVRIPARRSLAAAEDRQESRKLSEALKSAQKVIWSLIHVKLSGRRPTKGSTHA